MSKELQDLYKAYAKRVKEFDELQSKYDELERTIEAIGDIDSITELAERIETLEDDLSTAEEDIRELKNELAESKMPTNLEYLEDDFKSLCNNLHFQDELEALIRKYKGF